MQNNNLIATPHINDHSHEALRVVELAVGVDDLGPRREALPAPRAGDVLHVGHAEMDTTISLRKVEKAAFKIQTQLTEMIEEVNFRKLTPEAEASLLIGVPRVTLDRRSRTKCPASGPQ